jgi:hypothetical protein
MDYYGKPKQQAGNEQVDNKTKKQITKQCKPKKTTREMTT